MIREHLNVFRISPLDARPHQNLDRNEVEAHKHSNYAAGGSKSDIFIQYGGTTLSKARARKTCVDPEKLHIYHTLEERSFGG